MYRLLTFIMLFFTTIALQAEGLQTAVKHIKYKGTDKYIYRVTLTDKKGTSYSLSHPTRFLSRRSVERRKRQGLPIDSTDLPISHKYVKMMDMEGVNIIGQSRWQNTVLVRLKDSTLISHIRSLSCVRDCKLVWVAPDSMTIETRIDYEEQFEAHDSVHGEPYGKASEQIYCLNGDRLHNIGLYGEGMMIAVLDGGFKNADRIPAFQRADISGYRDFVNPEKPLLFSDMDHGTKVLSTMAVFQPYYFIGTAPKATYWLLRSEDQQSEQEVEEDYWTMAAEFADSVGCDVINSSLGYYEYDHKWMSYKLWQLDGRQSFASRSASLLASKGIVLCNSAGNSGMGPWKKIGIPADADPILCVGAVNDLEPHTIAPFSSVGPSQDGRVKPDVVAMGAPSSVVSARGTLTTSMGTSFASPIICGLVACLWQGLPQLTAEEIIQLVRESGDNREHPDNIYGYGLPNFWRAYMIGRMIITEH